MAAVLSYHIGARLEIANLPLVQFSVFTLQCRGTAKLLENRSVCIAQHSSQIWDSKASYEGGIEVLEADRHLNLQVSDC